MEVETKETRTIIVKTLSNTSFELNVDPEVSFLLLYDDIVQVRISRLKELIEEKTKI